MNTFSYNAWVKWQAARCKESVKNGAYEGRKQLTGMGFASMTFRLLLGSSDILQNVCRLNIQLIGSVVNSFQISGIVV